MRFRTPIAIEMQKIASMNPHPHRQLRRVLLVDDDRIIRFITRMALEMDGLEVFECASGSEALATMPTVRPDLVLLDVMMPRMSGLDVLWHLRAQPDWAATPVVFLTARGMQSEIADYFARGVTDVIVKPFDAVLLPQILRQLFLATQQQ